MIERVKAKDFLSWEELDITIPAGVTLLEGFNFDDNTSEGCGKSALLNAVAWGLYGKIPKDANIDEVIRHAAKSCSVEVYLIGDSKVVRTRKPNGLYLEIGDQRIRGKDAIETQQKIVEHLGMSFETFCQTMYFAQNYPNKFITANEKDRAKVFSEIIDLSIFDEARKRAHDKVKDVELEWTKLKAKVEYLPPMMEQVQSSLKSFKELKEECVIKHEDDQRELDDFVTDTTKDLNEVKRKLKDVRPQAREAAKVLEALDKNIEDLKEKDATLREKVAVIKSSEKTIKHLQNNIEASKSKISNLKKDLEELEECLTELKPKDKPCERCGASSSKEKQQEIFEDDKEGLQTDCEDVKIDIKDAKRDLKRFKKQLQEIGEASDIEVLQDRRQCLQDRIEELEEKAEAEDEVLEKEQKLVEDLQSLEDTLDTWDEKRARHSAQTPWKKYDEKIKEAKAERKELLAKESKLLAKEAKLRDEVAQFTILKSGFREVKSYVFRGVLAELSSRANEYVTQLFEVPIHIRFHNEGKDGEVSKILVDVEMNGITQSLGLYSGGQFRRICLSVDLALSDLIATRSGKASNLLFLDEYFKDLSEVSMEKILDLLQNTGKSIVLIEHNSIFKNIVQNSLHIEYRNKVSKFV